LIHLEKLDAQLRWICSYYLNRLIQEEKENTEARAEELEYRVSSLDHLVSNHVPGSGRSTPRVNSAGGAPGQASSSNHSPVIPTSSHNNPNGGFNSGNANNASNSSSPLANAGSNAAASPQRDYLHKFHTVLYPWNFFFMFPCSHDQGCTL